MNFLRDWKQRTTVQLYKRAYKLVPALLRPHEEGPQVLLYHNVEDIDCPLVNKLGITISPADFDEHVRYLTSRYKVVPVDDIARERGNPRAIAITFDDGFLSMLTAGLPILEKYGCPIKLYLTGVNMTGINWANQLSYLLNVLPPRDLEELARAALDNPPAPNGPPTFLDFIRAFSPDRTPRVIAEVFAKHWQGPMRRLYMTEAEIRQLAAHPLVRLGSHTRSHYPLHRLGPEQLHEEVVAHHSELNRLFDNGVDGFCMPFGFEDHLTEAVIAAVRQVDRCVVSAYGGRLDESVQHGLPEIKRIGIWGGNLGMLWYRLAHPI